MTGRLEKFYRLWRDTAGGSAVELAFVLPIMLALVAGTVDGGRALFAFNTVEKLAKEGARYASVRGSETPSPATQAEITDYLKSQATGLDNAKLTVNPTWPDGVNHDPGERVTVTVTYQYDALFAAFLPFEDFTLNSSATLNIMR